MTTWYTTWAAEYGTSFGLSDEEVKVILTWEPALIAAGATELDLQAVRLSLLADVTPLKAGTVLGKLTNHLGTIQQLLRRHRSVNLERQRQTYEHDYGQCGVCSGVGLVIVPHLEAIRNGEWRPLKTGRGNGAYYTQAVWCSCRLGEWKRGRWAPRDVLKPGDPRPMSLDEYDKKNPRWKEQEWKRMNEQRENAELVPASDEWAACIDRLLNIRDLAPGPMLYRP